MTHQLATDHRQQLLREAAAHRVARQANRPPRTEPTPVRTPARPAPSTTVPVVSTQPQPRAEEVETLILRRAGSRDADAIVELYEQLSLESRHARFHAPKPRIDTATRTRLTAIDGSTVWLAFDRDRCIGEARVISSEEACAELAVTIADRYQNQGLGSRLAQLAVKEHLRTNDCVTFTTMADNRRVVRMAETNHVVLRLDDGLLDGLITASAVRPNS